MFPSFNHEENGRQRHLVEEDMPVLLLSNPESKSLSRKSLKKLTSFPYSKRPRGEQQNDSITAASADDHGIKIGYDHLRCISDERFRIVKQKRGQDSKRIDKKSFKASAKTKFDPFASKAIIGSDSASGGIETHGLYGLKSDLYDVTQHVEELSLDELLDGSYKYPKFCREKGKKASSDNENILLLVRKACSILQLHGAASNYSDRKTSTSIPNPTLSSINMSDEDDKGIGGKESCSKVSSQEILSTSTLYRPKDILEHLTLPPKLDLEDFISNLNPSQCTMGMKVFSSSSLPPWSFSHGGTCKPVLDSCRFSLPRGGGQSKWVRIERRSTSTGDDNSRLSGLEKKTFDYYDNLANQQKVDELLQDVEVLSESVLHPFSGPQSTSESHGLHCSNLVKESGASCSLESIELEPHHEHSKNQKKDDYKDNLCDQNSESEAGLRCLGNESSLADSPKPDPLCKGNEIVQDEHPRRITDDCCRGCSGYSSRCSTRGYEQGLSRSPASDVPKQGRSSELLAAASILCEIASCSHAKKAQKDTFMRAKCAFMEKKSKYLNTSSSVERTERLFLAPRNHESFKRAAIPSSRVHKLISEQQREFTHTDNVSREPVKWFVSAEVGCASSTKLEKNHTKTNNRVLHGNSIKQSGLMPSPIKVENVYGSHLKLGKEKLKASSVIFEENSTKDRSRVKSQRG